MHLTIRNFKSFKERSFNLNNEEINLVFGDSGVGKSTIVEAIYYAITGNGKNNKKMRTKSKIHISLKMIVNNAILHIVRESRPATLKVQYKDKVYNDDVAQEILFSIFGKIVNLSSILKQNETNSFLSLNPAQKVDFIYEISGNKQEKIENVKSTVINIIKELKESINNKNIYLESNIKNLCNYDSDTILKDEEYQQLRKDKKSIDEKIIKNQQLNIKLNIQLAEFKSQLEAWEKYEECSFNNKHLAEKLKTLNYTIDQFPDILLINNEIQKLNGLLIKQENINKIIKCNENYIEKQDAFKKLECLQQSISNISYEELIISQNAYSAYCQKTRFLKENKDRYIQETSIQASKHRYDELVKQSGIVCPKCSYRFCNEDNRELKELKKLNLNYSRTFLETYSEYAKAPIVQDNSKELEYYTGVRDEITRLQNELEDIVYTELTEEDELIGSIENIQKTKLGIDFGERIKCKIESILNEKNISETSLEFIEKNISNIHQPKFTRLQLTKRIRFTKENIVKNSNNLNLLKNTLNKIILRLSSENVASKYKRLIKEKECLNNEIDDLTSRLFNHQEIIKTIKEGESIFISSFLAELSSMVNEYLSYFFPESEGMYCEFRSHKHLITKDIDKPDINLWIYHKDRESQLDNLSGGELQRLRVAIVAAVSKFINSPILILDESTSNLDEEATGNVVEGLKKLNKGQTIIIIAHQVIQGLFTNVVEVK